MNKVCAKCNLLKEYSDFTTDNRTKDGKRSECTVCSRKMKKMSYRRDPRQHLLRGCKKRSKDSGVPFSLTKEDIEIPDFCPILGLPLSIADDRATDTSPSVDRIVPNLGYIPGNIHVISYRANRIKNDSTLEELQKIVSYFEGMNNENQ